MMLPWLASAASHVVETVDGDGVESLGAHLLTTGLFGGSHGGAAGDVLGNAIGVLGHRGSSG